MTSTPQVQTVRGPVAASDLGTVLMHEHVFVLSEEFRQSLPGTWDERERVGDAVTRLKALAATGVTTIAMPGLRSLLSAVGAEFPVALTLGRPCSCRSGQMT